MSLHVLGETLGHDTHEADDQVVSDNESFSFKYLKCCNRLELKVQSHLKPSSNFELEESQILDTYA